jgi:putative NADH-flavin reductase
MRVTVFGATGRTGRLVVDEALRRGIEATALVRNRARATFDAGVRIVDGDARDAAAVTTALEDSDAAISVMAIPEGTPPITDLSDAVRTIVEAMEAGGPRRLVVTANASVFHDTPVAPPFDVVAEEHRRNAARLRASSLDWTLLAPMFLTDDPGTDAFTAHVDAKGGGGLPRADLTLAVLDALDHDEWIGHVVGLSASSSAGGAGRATS